MGKGPAKGPKISHDFGAKLEQKLWQENFAGITDRGADGAFSNWDKRGNIEELLWEGMKEVVEPNQGRLDLNQIQK